MAEKMIISIEGADGTGKSSVANFLVKQLEVLGFKSLLVREPGSTSVGEYIRNLLLYDWDVKPTPQAELFLYSAARSQLIVEQIVPAIENGKIIVCDRYIDSTVVYQGIVGGLGFRKVLRLMEDFFEDYFPDITFVLDSSVEVILKRLSDKDKIESRGDEYLEKVVEGFRMMARLYPDRMVLVDSNVSLSIVKDLIWKKLQEKLTNL